jgi:hypothetical protein
MLNSSADIASRIRGTERAKELLEGIRELLVPGEVYNG